MLSRKLSVLGLLIILIITGAVLWNSYAASSVLSESNKEYTIKKVLGRNLRAEKPNDAGWTDNQNNYFTIHYPSGATIFTDKNRTGQDNNNTLILFSFDTKNPRAVFASGVYQVENNSRLEEMSPVKLRKSLNNLYTESIFEISGIKGLYFNKKNGEVEKTIFLLKNNLLYSFSLTGLMVSGEIDSLFDKLISSINIL